MKTKIEVLKKWIENNIAYILPLCTVGLALLLVLSYMIPKKVIDTYKTNTTEEEGDTERILPLTENTCITYHMNTGNRPMMGIHIGVSKNEHQYTDAALGCNVYSKNGDLLSENQYALSQGDNMQYIYIPFSQYEQCQGDIVIEWKFLPGKDGKENNPGILANGRNLTKAYTEVDGEKIEGNIKTIYVYTHNTYPLVYDLRILTAVFFAASMMVDYRNCLHKRKENGTEKTDHDKTQGVAND